MILIVLLSNVWNDETLFVWVNDNIGILRDALKIIRNPAVWIDVFKRHVKSFLFGQYYNDTISRSKHIYVAQCVESKSEAHSGRDKAVCSHLL